ncbi:Hypothetical protein A7982_01411 [Minicystis rosea]|nr:Hypothetical protein A7982_01411 [Minicystis rosea]
MLSRASIFATLAPSIFIALAPGCGGGGETHTDTTSSSTSASSSSSSGTGGAGGDTTSSTTSSSSSGTGGSGGCARAPGPADGPRKLVVGHPYDADANASKVWEVLDLDAAGTLTKTGTTFEMGRAFWGEVAFTPDGKVGIAVHDDGTLGVFRFETSGEPTVVHASFKGSFYAGTVIIDPSGDGAFVLDENWRNNGGGLYRISIGCDGTLTDLGSVAPSKLARGMVRLGQTPNHAVLAATDVLTSKAGDNAHLLDLGGAAPTLLAGAPAFADDEAIISAIARTHDDRFVLIGDNSEFASVPNRVAVVGVSGASLTAAQTLSPIEDPVSIVTSPFDNAALVVSGYGNAFFALGYDPGNTTAPFTVKGQVTYVGKKPQLPANAVLVDRGALRGRVWVAENEGVRQVRFEQNGDITDIGLFSLGSEIETLVGAIGVTP